MAVPRSFALSADDRAVLEAADKFARGGYTGSKPLPTRDNPWNEETATAESSRPLAAIAAAVMSFCDMTYFFAASSFASEIFLADFSALSAMAFNPADAPSFSVICSSARTAGSDMKKAPVDLH